jgi:S-adenosylmethionine decarboxylase
LRIAGFFIKLLVIKDLTLLETYTPGLHLIATLHSDNTALLAGYAGFKSLADDLTGAFDLQKLGEVYHDFEPGGFTGVICLSESHLSVHTWPEFGKLTWIFTSAISSGSITEPYGLFSTGLPPISKRK